MLTVRRRFAVTTFNSSMRKAKSKVYFDLQRAQSKHKDNCLFIEH